MRSWKRFILLTITIICGFNANCAFAYSDNDFSEYMANLRKKIQYVWKFPDSLEEGHTSVVFKINREGHIISATVTESSGNVLFDETALNTVLKAAPFGNFPEDTKKDCITIQYNFETKNVKTDLMKKYLWESEKYRNKDNKLALEYIDKAIEEVKGDCASYFLYARRCKLNKALGDFDSADKDIAECKRLKTIYDTKRINAAKIVAMEENSPLAYFSLANAYDIAGDYSKALENIDRAISLTPLNQAYKRYRDEISTRQNSEI